MPRSPAISIVMPVRDAAATLPAALASICDQTFPDWELVAVDDGSADDSSNLLEAIGRRDSRVRLIRQPAEGIVAALRCGCAEARGAFIARMDADDLMDPQRLERQLAQFTLDPAAGLVSCRVRHGGEPVSQAGYAHHVSWINSLRTPEEITLRRFVESPVAHPSVIFRRELIHQHGGYAEGDFPEDYELWLRWLDDGVRFTKVHAELLTWNDSTGRLSRNDSRYRPEAFYRLKCRYIARWLRREIPAEKSAWLWGAGRVTRRRFASLENEGVRIAGFIDVDPAKVGRLRDGRPVVLPDNLPPAAESVIIAGVGVRGARELIVAQLEKSGRVEGRDYIIAA